MTQPKFDPLLPEIAALFDFTSHDIPPGAWFIAHRSGPWRVGQCHKEKDGYIIPNQMMYCYNTGECFPAKLPVNEQLMHHLAEQSSAEMKTWSANLQWGKS